eukprot:scaffold157837_cov41-Prasinocladus_malaysianus.AAC.1
MSLSCSYLGGSPKKAPGIRGRPGALVSRPTHQMYRTVSAGKQYGCFVRPKSRITEERALRWHIPGTVATTVALCAGDYCHLVSFLVQSPESRRPAQAPAQVSKPILTGMTKAGSCCSSFCDCFRISLHVV